jgi:hypothetical protein
MPEQLHGGNTRDFSAAFAVALLTVRPEAR